MRDSDFANWLANVHLKGNGAPLRPAVQSTAVSRCRRIERHEGDLDKHYATDRMAALVGKFDYPAEAEARRLPAAHAIHIDGNVREGTASLRSALLLYRSFLEWRSTAAVRR